VNKPVRPANDQMGTQDHWESVYRSKDFDSLSWYAPHLAESLRLIQQLCPDKASAVVDVGGGESTLVDDLLLDQYLDLSVLDISGTAIEFTKRRLGPQSDQVNWHVGDVTQYDFGAKRFDLWHDRAVFHFLTEPIARQAYVGQVRRFVKPGGHVLIATFGPEGPLQCSGLDVVRFDADRLSQVFGDGFNLLGQHLVNHYTPAGTKQQFLYAWMQVVGSER